MTLKDVFETFIGEYTPDYTAADFGQLDIPYILGAILLIVMAATLIKSLRMIFMGVIGRDR